MTSLKKPLEGSQKIQLSLPNMKQAVKQQSNGKPTGA
jgi:hypothetical protein